MAATLERLATANGVLRLLLVDDDQVDRLAVRRALHGVRMQLDELDSAHGVAEQLARFRYDCLILDQELPGEDGLTLIERLRAAGVRVPILVVTGHDDDIGARLVAGGASDYLAKRDLTPELLIRRLRYAIQVGRAEAEARVAQRQLAAERSVLDAVVRQNPTAMLVADAKDETIALANEAARLLFGNAIKAGDPIATLGECVARRGDGSALDASAWPLVRALLAGETISGEEIMLRTPSHAALVRVSAAPVIIESGTVAAVMTLDDITEERRVLSALERTVAARDEMLAVVSHDLRNPLAAIGLALEELGVDELEPEARARYVAATRRSLARAHRLIEDLLEVSRIDAGQLAIEAMLLDAVAIVTQAARDHELLLKGAGLHLDLVVSTREAWVRGDRHRLLQALGNLIGNALHHGRAGGVVEVGITSGETTVEMWVADRGPGVPTDVLPRVFDRYWQARRTRRAGAGLGLAIVKGIVDAHGGAVQAENRADGGARFVVSLPVATER